MTLGVALACLLGLVLVAWLLLPVAREAGGVETPPTDERSELEDLYIQREGTYSTLKELDFDHETGKLILDDYRELRSRYSEEAILILKRIDELEAVRDVKAGRGARAAKAASLAKVASPMKAVVAANLLAATRAAADAEATAAAKADSLANADIPAPAKSKTPRESS